MGKFTNVIANGVVSETRVYSWYIHQCQSSTLLTACLRKAWAKQPALSPRQRDVLSSHPPEKVRVRGIEGMWALERTPKQPLTFSCKHLHQVIGDARSAFNRKRCHRRIVRLRQEALWAEG